MAKLFTTTTVFAAVAGRYATAIEELNEVSQYGVVENFMLPMRDGVKLHTDVLVPLHLEKPDKKFPTVMDRSPYGEFSTELVADIYLPFGAATVTQDFRGTQASEGNFTLWHKAANDTADTIAWIREQKWSDGRVYTVGASADGIASLLVPLDPSSNLSGQFVIWATANAYNTIYPGGAYRSGLIDGWLESTVPNQAPGLIKDVRKKEAALDQWWLDVALSNHWDAITAPGVFWAGWYDIFLRGTLFAFNGYQHYTKPETAGKSFLVVDPLGHCQAAASNFHGDLIFGRVALPILLGIELFLGNLEPSPAEGVQAVTFYVMGPNYLFLPHRGNFWTSLPEWPKPTSTHFYLHADGILSKVRPIFGGSTTFLYDPDDVCPTIGGNNLKLACGPLDQRPLENRSDVLVFTTSPLEEDIALTGALNAHLFVSTANANDTDWVVRLTDVYPKIHGGGSHLIQDGIVRMRWRNVFTNKDPQPITPGQIEKITMSLWNTSYVFNKGHRIRVSVTSSNSPRFSTNENLGLPLSMINNSHPSKYIIAKNTLHFGNGVINASYIELPVVPLSALPIVNVTSFVERKFDQITNGDREMQSKMMKAMKDYEQKLVNLH
jgi:hypothetical protein